MEHIAKRQLHEFSVIGCLFACFIAFFPVLYYYQTMIVREACL